MIKKYANEIQLEKGQEVGKFKVGSTIVLIHEIPSNFKFNIKVGQKVRYGDIFGKII